MPDIVTYLLCGVRPKAKTTVTIKAESGVGPQITLITRTHTPAGDVETSETRKDGAWTVTMDALDCIVELTGPDDLAWTGVTLSIEGGVASFVTYEGEKEAIWDGQAVSTQADASPKGNPKDPWPPPGTATRLDTSWLTPTLKRVADAMSLPRDDQPGA